MAIDKQKLVKTVDGTQEKRGNCRKIAGEFYRIGDPKVKDSGQCYKVGGKYCRYGTGFIEYDHTVGEYVRKKDSLQQGIVEIKGQDLVEGYFSHREEDPIYITDVNGKKFLLMKEELIENNKFYRYAPMYDAYFHITRLPASKFTQLPRLDMGYKQNLPYDCREVIHQYTDAYDRASFGEVTPQQEKITKITDGLSFGVEFETSKGMIPHRKTKPLGLIPLRDGSVNGLEYATVPYEGIKGVQALAKSCDLLNRFTDYDDSCSLHIHIGNVPRTEKFFLALFITLCSIQDEIYEMFPLFKKYNFGVKRKHYTKPLPALEMLHKFDPVITDDKVKDNFAKLFYSLSGGQRYRDVGNDLINVVSHPSDPHGTRKWNIKSRYHWVNLIPLLFGNKKTVEFRIHTPTTDVNKVMLYLMLCTSIVGYVKNNTNSILKQPGVPLLNDIIISQNRNNDGSLVNQLLKYTNVRKRHVMTWNHEGNIRGREADIKAYKVT